MSKWIFSPIFAISTAICSVFLLLSLMRTDTQLEESAAIRDHLKQEVIELENKVQVVRHKATQATSSANKEQIIRNELLKKKPNEYVVQLPNLEEILDKTNSRENNQQRNADSQTHKKEKETPLVGWIRLLTGNRK